MDNAVALVALPKARLHPDALAEAAVVRARPSYLAPIWSNADWDVFRVVDAAPLATNGATVTEIRPQSILVQAQRVGVTIVRFRYTSAYRVRSGAACLSEAPGGWIRLDVRSAGAVKLVVSNLPDILTGASTSTKCSSMALSAEQSGRRTMPSPPRTHAAGVLARTTPWITGR